MSEPVPVEVEPSPAPLLRDPPPPPGYHDPLEGAGILDEPFADPSEPVDRVGGDGGGASVHRAEDAG